MSRMSRKGAERERARREMVVNVHPLYEEPGVLAVVA